MPKEYAVEGAQLECDKGTKPSNLKVSSKRTVLLGGKFKANIGDCTPGDNVPPFCMCNSKTNPEVIAANGAPVACTPTCTEWRGGKSDVLVQGQRALLTGDTAFCPFGAGIIKVKTSGQTNRVLILEKVEGVKPLEFRKFSDPSSKKTNSEKKNEEESANDRRDVKLGKPSATVGRKIQEKFISQYQNRINKTPGPNNPNVEFQDKRGESRCILKKNMDPKLRGQLEADLKNTVPPPPPGIYYHNGIPDFTPVAVAEVEIEGMKGGDNGRAYNFPEADKALANQIVTSKESQKLESLKQLGVDNKNINAKALEKSIAKYRKKNGLTWHELNDMKTMQLVPTSVNGKFKHLGGVGEINLLS